MQSKHLARRARSAVIAAAALLAAVNAATAQSARVDGVVRGEDGLPVVLAAVRLSTAAGVPIDAVETDSAGRFRFAGLAAGRYELRAHALGYREERRALELSPGQSLVLEIVLDAAPLELEGLEATADRARRRFEEEAGLTVRELDARSLRLLPGLAEADVMRAIETLPGVISTSDFSAAFNVRGGGGDQNLILLDGFPIYNPFHLAGMFGVFNPDMVARAELLAGGFPARHGGRVASVLRIESDVGVGGFDFAGGLSVLATRVAVGADVPTGILEHVGLLRARVRLGARRSYFDQLLRSFVDFPYHLGDMQLYGEAWTPGGARLHITGYSGIDVLDLGRMDPERFPLRLTWDWGNDVAGIGASVPLGEGRSAELRAGFTRFGTALVLPDFADSRFTSRIEETFAAGVFSALIGDWTLMTGADMRRQQYANVAITGGTVFRESRDVALHGAAHAQLGRRFGPWLVEAGVRVDGWWPDTGPPSLEPAPRLALKRFVAGGEAAWKLAFGRYTQFAHSVRDEELPFGIDLWILAGERAPVVVSDQVQLGYERFFGTAWRAEAEAYYRTFDGVIANNFVDDPNDPLDDLIPGRGLSYGGDVLLERRTDGGIDGWLTLSLLKATRTFPDVLSGLDPAPSVTYPPIFDRRVDLELVAQFPLPANASAGLRWNFGSGLPYTRPLGSFAYHDYELRNGRYIRNERDDTPGEFRAVVLGGRNADRYPPYHRLDIGVRREFRPGRWRIEPYLEVLNVYNRRNVLFYFYEFDRDPPVRSGVSMFPVLPTIGAEIRF